MLIARAVIRCTGGGAPSPRKESAASAMIADAMANVPITSADCMRFGRRRLKMMRVCVAPSERAAVTHSRSWTTFGISLLFISHDMAVVERISHRVAVMYLGEIVESGLRESVFAAPRHPYTRKLLDFVPVADPARRRHKPPQTSEIPSPVKGLDYVPERRAMLEVAPVHFVQEH